MSKTIRTYTGTITVSSGAGSLDITSDEFRPITDAGGYLEQILVKAVRVTDTFKVAIEDSDGFEVYDGEGSDGKLNDITRIPLRGDYVIYIKSATTAGAYRIKLKFKEDW